MEIEQQLYYMDTIWLMILHDILQYFILIFPGL